MGWLDPDKIQYNSEKIYESQKKISDISGDIGDIRDTIIEELENMKTDWNTPEGRKFISEINTDWSTHVNSYLKILNALDDMLRETYTIYSELDSKIKNLTF